MRRYVLVEGQSEDMFINWKGFMVYILYIHNVVGGVIELRRTLNHYFSEICTS